MAKTKTNKQAVDAIVRNAPASAKWLNQPINITFMSGDLSLNQVNTMIEVVDALQDKIHTALTEKQKSVFTDEDFDAQGKVVVPVPFKMMTDDPRRYAYFESVAKSLAETAVTMERVGKDGKPYTSIKPIINEARIPLSEKGNRGVIEFIIEKDMIDALFDLTRYNRYIKSIAKSAKSVYTSRIYQFITAYKNIGAWRPLYKDLHIMFGLSHWKTDPKTKEKEWIADKYPNYRQFKQKILKVAHDELMELAESKEVDCYFDFNEIYPPGKANGMPERIEFIIHTTEYGQQSRDSIDISKQLIAIDKLLKDVYGLNVADRKQVMALVDKDNIDFCRQKIDEIGEWMNKNGGVEDKRKYMTVSLKNALMETIPTVKEDEQPTPDEEEVIHQMFDRWIKTISKDWQSAFTAAGVEEGKLVVTLPGKTTLDTYIRTCGQDKLNDVIIKFK